MPEISQIEVGGIVYDIKDQGARTGKQDAITETGLLKSNGSSVTAAVAGTDYLAPSAGKLYQKVLITTSGTWSPPYDGIYTVTLLGGGGGGGSGFSVYDASLNSSSNFPRTNICGASGDASVSVTKRLALYQDETYTFVIGAGGNARTGHTYVMETAGDGSTLGPTFTSGDMLATVGGETSMKIGNTVVFNTSERVEGCDYIAYASPWTSSTKINIYGGASGAGKFPGKRNSVKTSNSEITNAGKVLVIEGGESMMGCGSGSQFDMTKHRNNTPSHAGNAVGYGCGGGGGCAPFVDSSTPTYSTQYSFVNKGGKGGNGYALIEWFAPLVMPQQ